MIASSPALPIRLLGVLVLATALSPFAMQVFLPALPVIQDELRTAPATAQLVLSLSALSIALATLAYGPLADRFGRRPTMLAGLVVYLVGSIACIVAPSIGWLIAGRIVQAVGGSAGLVLSRTIVRDLFPMERAAVMLAYITMAMVTAPMLAPALGGIVADLAGWRAIFAVSAVPGLLALVAVWLELTETRPAASGNRHSMPTLRAFTILLRSRAFRGYTLNVAFSVGVWYAFLAAAPYVMIRLLGRPAAEYGVLFAIVTGAFMAGNFTAARISERIGTGRMIVGGSGGCLIATLVLLALAVLGPTTVWGLIVPTSVAAFFQGLAMPNAQAAAVSVNPAIAGAASGLAMFVQMGVAALAAQISGSIQVGSALPMAIGMASCALVAMAGAIAGVSAGRRRTG